MTHSYITITSRLPRSNEEPVRALLDALGNPLKEPLKSIVDRLERIHFFSITIVPGDAELVPHLVFELSVDGDEKSLLDSLAREAQAQLEPVFKLAAGYDAKRGLASFWHAHSVQGGFGYFDIPGVCHTGTPGMSVERIRKEAGLAAQVRKLFKETPRVGSALDVLNRVRDALRPQADYGWAFETEPTPLLKGKPGGNIVLAVLGLWWPLVKTYLLPFFIIGMALSAWMILPQMEMTRWSEVAALVKTILLGAGFGFLLSLAFAITIYVKLRDLEESDIPDDSDPEHARIDAIMKREDFAYQNHLAGISIMKPGRVRQFTLRLIFWLIAGLVTKLYRPGFLGTIGTIHFARWIMLPGTNRLLFFSNYGGSWENYLEDFITKAASGLTGVWSNTIGYPKTNNLILGGATDGDRFKRWARRQQQPTWCWYSAYPALTTARIRTNAAIRQGIAGAATETEAQDWIALFGSVPLPRTELASDNIQSLLFGGFGPLRYGTCLLIRLPEHAEDARQWLSAISGRIHFGDQKPTDCEALLFALSASGLRKMGLSDSELATFPPAFSFGMAKRDRILGDCGSSHPEQWNWGGRHPVDASLLIYGMTPEALEAAVEIEKQTLTQFGCALVHRVVMKPLPEKGTPLREPFGFVDGVSQPIIRGTGKHKPGASHLHIMEPGEFVLGYPDGLGTYPKTPQVPAIADRHNDLYAAPWNWTETRPDFSSSLAPVSRDFGRDGTYIVIRQLEQDTEGFKGFLQDAVQQLHDGPTHIEVDEQWVAAKMVGRWPDGSSLVRNPYEPATNRDPKARGDNNFYFGKEDPQGLRCPFGSHIRRANPRESFDPDSIEQLAITNRHRILRAGRVYEEGDKTGLLFVCLNADIERQFEFIQQSWLNASSFHGLENEVDPISNPDGTPGTYTIPMEDGARCITGIQHFITTRGGEYFFMPGYQALTFLMRER